MYKNESNSQAPILLGPIRNDSSARNVHPAFSRQRHSSRRTRRGQNSSQYSRETDSTCNSELSGKSSSSTRQQQNSFGVSVSPACSPINSRTESKNVLPPVKTDEYTPNAASSSRMCSAGNPFERSGAKSADGSVMPQHGSRRESLKNHTLNNPIVLQAPVGLYSLGNTCYMNAALQCVMHTTGFLESLREAVLAREGKVLGDAPTPASSALLDLARAVATRRQAPFLRAIKSRAAAYNDQFEGDQQNDAHEFLRTFLMVIHDELNTGQGSSAEYQEMEEMDLESENEAFMRWRAHIKTVDDSVVYDYFGGMMRSRCECRKCGHVSFSFDPFLDLTLSLVPSDGKSISTALRREYQSDNQTELRGENRLLCPTCKRKQPYFRSTCVLAWPRNLVLHLNRFRGDGTKDSSKFAYPVLFTIGNLKYRLYAVCCHSGTTDHGHYTSYIGVNSGTGSPQSSRFPSSPTRYLQKWYYCSDDTVVDVATSESSAHTSSAYILFYCLAEKSF